MMRHWPDWFFAAMEACAFVSRFPHFISVLSRVKPLRARAIQVMAIALEQPTRPEGTILLYVNPDWLERHPEEFSGVLQHEIHHVICGHLTDSSLHCVADRVAMVFAMEVTANEFINDRLPAGVIDWRRLRFTGVRPHQSTLERYRLISRFRKKHGYPSFDSYASFDCHNPGAMGNAGAGVGDLIDRRSFDAKLGRRGLRYGLGLPHSEEELSAMARAVAAHMQNLDGALGATGSATRISHAEPRSLLSAPLGPNLDWAWILSEVFRAQRTVRPTYLRPNRRFPARLGEIPGRYRRPPRPNLLVGIDSSGSMPEIVLARIVAEVRRLESVARTTVVICDAAIHEISEGLVAGDSLPGGGDTDFQPVFELAAKDPIYQGIIYFTDGYGAYPAIPPQVPTLWILCAETLPEPPFGHILGWI